uniref:Uncharacterized protein n=1 Tax=Rhizophora mucronata TaxID=61149 RepID=A0A2P2N0D3_RHIMU
MFGVKGQIPVTIVCYRSMICFRFAAYNLNITITVFTLF